MKDLEVKILVHSIGEPTILHMPSANKVVKEALATVGWNLEGLVRHLIPKGYTVVVVKGI